MNRSLRSRGKRAFSISEIVVSMALIVMLTLAGFSACYLGARIQAIAVNNVDICNFSHMFRSAFVETAVEVESVDSPENIQKFILGYNKRIAFSFNCKEFQLNDFQGKYVLDGEPWEKTSVLVSEVKLVPPENPNDKPIEETVIISAVTLSYSGSFLNLGAQKPSNNFVYRFYNREVEVRAEINFLGENYLSVEGGLLGYKNPSYTLTQEFPNL